MSQLSLDKFGENLPVSGIVGFSQVAIGLGAGFLVAESIGQNARRSAGIALVGLGVADRLKVRLAGRTVKLIEALRLYSLPESAEIDVLPKATLALFKLRTARPDESVTAEPNVVAPSPKTTVLPL